MKNNLGEVFYDGRIIKLNSTDEEELKDILTKIKTDKVDAKEQIEVLLDQMMKI